jgi:hypothetical protein
MWRPSLLWPAAAAGARRHAAAGLARAAPARRAAPLRCAAHSLPPSWGAGDLLPAATIGAEALWERWAAISAASAAPLQQPLGGNLGGLTQGPAAGLGLAGFLASEAD